MTGDEVSGGGVQDRFGLDRVADVERTDRVPAGAGFVERLTEGDQCHVDGPF